MIVKNDESSCDRFENEEFGKKSQKRLYKMANLHIKQRNIGLQQS